MFCNVSQRFGLWEWKVNCAQANTSISKCNTQGRMRSGGRGRCKNPPAWRKWCNIKQGNTIRRPQYCKMWLHPVWSIQAFDPALNHTAPFTSKVRFKHITERFYWLWNGPNFKTPSHLYTSKKGHQLEDGISRAPNILWCLSHGTSSWIYTASDKFFPFFFFLQRRGNYGAPSTFPLHSIINLTRPQKKERGGQNADAPSAQTAY